MREDLAAFGARQLAENVKIDKEKSSEFREQVQAKFNELDRRTNELGDRRRAFIKDFVQPTKSALRSLESVAKKSKGTEVSTFEKTIGELYQRFVAWEGKLVVAEKEVADFGVEMRKNFMKDVERGEQLERRRKARELLAEVAKFQKIIRDIRAGVFMPQLYKSLKSYDAQAVAEAEKKFIPQVLGVFGSVRLKAIMDIDVNKTFDQKELDKIAADLSKVRMKLPHLYHIISSETLPDDRRLPPHEEGAVVTEVKPIDMEIKEVAEPKAELPAIPELTPALWLERIKSKARALPGSSLGKLKLDKLEREVRKKKSGVKNKLKKMEGLVDAAIAAAGLKISDELTAPSEVRAALEHGQPETGRIEVISSAERKNLLAAAQAEWNNSKELLDNRPADQVSAVYVYLEKLASMIDKETGEWTDNVDLEDVAAGKDFTRRIGSFHKKLEELLEAGKEGIKENNGGSVALEVVSAPDKASQERILDEFDRLLYQTAKLVHKVPQARRGKQSGQSDKDKDEFQIALEKKNRSETEKKLREYKDTAWQSLNAVVGETLAAAKEHQGETETVIEFPREESARGQKARVEALQVLILRAGLKPVGVASERAGDNIKITVKVKRDESTIEAVSKLESEPEMEAVEGVMTVAEAEKYVAEAMKRKLVLPSHRFRTHEEKIVAGTYWKILLDTNDVQKANNAMAEVKNKLDEAKKKAQEKRIKENAARKISKVNVDQSKGAVILERNGFGPLELSVAIPQAKECRLKQEGEDRITGAYGNDYSFSLYKENNYWNIRFLIKGATRTYTFGASGDTVEEEFRRWFGNFSDKVTKVIEGKAEPTATPVEFNLLSFDQKKSAISSLSNKLRALIRRLNKLRYERKISDDEHDSREDAAAQAKAALDKLGNDLMTGVLPENEINSKALNLVASINQLLVESEDFIDSLNAPQPAEPATAKPEPAPSAAEASKVLENPVRPLGNSKFKIDGSEVDMAIPERGGSWGECALITSPITSPKDFLQFLYNNGRSISTFKIYRTKAGLRYDVKLNNKVVAEKQELKPPQTWVGLLKQFRENVRETINVEPKAPAAARTPAVAPDAGPGSWEDIERQLELFESLVEDVRSAWKKLPENDEWKRVLALTTGSENVQGFLIAMKANNATVDDILSGIISDVRNGRDDKEKESRMEEAMPKFYRLIGEIDDMVESYENLVAAAAITAPRPVPAPATAAAAHPPAPPDVAPPSPPDVVPPVPPAPPSPPTPPRRGFWGRVKDKLFGATKAAVNKEFGKTAVKVGYDTVGTVLGVKFIGDLVGAGIGAAGRALFKKDLGFGDINTRIVGAKEVKSEKSVINTAYNELLAAVHRQREVGAPPAAGGEVEERFDDLVDIIQGAHHIKTEEKRELLVQLRRVISERDASINAAAVEREDATRKLLEMSVRNKVAGMKIWRDALNTLLTAAGGGVVKGAVYGLLSALEITQRGRVRHEKATLEQGSEAGSSAKYIKEAFATSARETARGLMLKGEQPGATGKRRAVDFVRSLGVALRGLGLAGLAMGGFGNHSEGIDRLLHGLQEGPGATGKALWQNMQEPLNLYSHPIDNIWHPFLRRLHIENAPATSAAEGGTAVAEGATASDWRHFMDSITHRGATVPGGELHQAIEAHHAMEGLGGMKGAEVIRDAHGNIQEIRIDIGKSGVPAERMYDRVAEAVLGKQAPHGIAPDQPLSAAGKGEILNLSGNLRQLALGHNVTSHGKLLINHDDVKYLFYEKDGQLVIKDPDLLRAHFDGLVARAEHITGASGATEAARQVNIGKSLHDVGYSRDELHKMGVDHFHKPSGTHGNAPHETARGTAPAVPGHHEYPAEGQSVYDKILGTEHPAKAPSATAAGEAPATGYDGLHTFPPASGAWPDGHAVGSHAGGGHGHGSTGAEHHGTHHQAAEHTTSHKHVVKHTVEKTGAAAVTAEQMKGLRHELTRWESDVRRQLNINRESDELKVFDRLADKINRGLKDLKPAEVQRILQDHKVNTDDVPALLKNYPSEPRHDEEDLLKKYLESHNPAKTMRVAAVDPAIGKRAFLLKDKDCRSVIVVDKRNHPHFTSSQKMIYKVVGGKLVFENPADHSIEPFS